VTAQLLAPVSEPTAAGRPAARVAPVRVTPVRVAQRYAAVAGVAIVLGALHLRHRPATVCVFRAVTGLPCPFCGGTTAAVHLGHGDIGGALRASPLAVALLATWPLLGSFRQPRWWSSHPRVRWAVITTVLIGSEIWQLVRFSIIHL
jgi:hypothetical protein